MKLLKDNNGENVGDLEFSHNFLGTTPKVQSIKEKIERRISLKLNSSALRKLLLR